MARKVRCVQGRCMCCERSGCRSHREGSASKMLMPPAATMESIMGPLMRSVLAARTREQQPMMAPLLSESPQQMRRRMEAEWANFFGEFERGNKMKVLRRRK